jgi:hypothetical protein
MTPFAIKCYLPGRRTQYVLYAQEDTSIELGRGADLRPRGFDEDVRVQFRLVGGQWFVTPQLGVSRRADGSPIEGTTALTLPWMLALGSATIVVDAVVDPRLPAQVVHGVASVAATTNPSLPQRSASRPLPPSSRLSARAKSQASVPVRQPYATSPKPAVALVPHAPEPQMAPPPPPPTPLARAAVRREVVETQILDMSQLGLPQAPEEPPEEPPSPAPRTVLGQLRTRRMALYAVIGAALVVFRFGMLRASGASALAHPTPPRAESAARALPASASPRPRARVEPLPPGYEPTPKRAGDWYATGDYVNALREYRGLAAQPDADPVFAIIVHALERRLEHPEMKR